MAEMTIEQQRALARARAKLAAEMSHPGTSGKTAADKSREFKDGVTNFVANGAFPALINTMFPQAASHGYKEKMADSAAFGFGDNLSGAANAAAAGLMGEPVGVAYEEGRDASRERMADFAKAHPTTSGTADIMGVLSGSGALAANGLTLMRGGTSALGAGGRGMVEGGLYGGAHAAGRRDGNLAENAEAAAKGALVGGAISGPLSAGMHGITNALARRSAMKAAPAKEDLLKGADAAYSRARAANPQFPTFDSFAKQVRPVLDDQGFHPRIHPRVAVAIDEIENELKKGIPDFKKLEKLRRIAKGAASSIEADEKRLGTILVKGLDDYMESAAPMADVAVGRELYGRYKRSDLIDTLTDKAARRAARTGSGGNIENTTRQNIDKILDNPKLSAGFSADDLALMRKIVEGAPGQDKLRLLGKLSPSGNGLMAALLSGSGIGAAVGTGNVASALPFVALGGVGMGAKSASERMTRKMAELLSAQVRAGRPIPTTAGITAGERALAQYAGSRPAHVGKAAGYALEGAEGTADALVRLLMTGKP